MYNNFDELEGIATDSVKPFFAIDLSNESDVLSWLKKRKKNLRQKSTAI